MKHTELERPEGLSDKGNLAYDKIMSFLEENGLTNTGGCKAFYSPKEWQERGEEYGCDSVLVIVHDGGDHGNAFSYDREEYEVLDAMIEHLHPSGVYPEQCTCWYTAIYAE